MVWHLPVALVPTAIINLEQGCFSRSATSRDVFVCLWRSRTSLTTRDNTKVSKYHYNYHTVRDEQQDDKQIDEKISDRKMLSRDECKMDGWSRDR